MTRRADFTKAFKLLAGWQKALRDGGKQPEKNPPARP
jgi:hypothetical protein